MKQRKLIQNSVISSDECIRQLSIRNKTIYKKGYIDQNLKIKLLEDCKHACRRAKDKTYPNNPSSRLYLFIEALEEALAEKDN